MCEEDVFGTDYSYSDNSYTFDSWSDCGESHHPYSREEVFEINHNARLDHDSQTIIHYDAYDSIDLNPQPGIKTIINFHDTTQLKKSGWRLPTALALTCIPSPSSRTPSLPSAPPGL